MFKFEVDTAQFQKIQAKVKSDVDQIIGSQPMLTEVGAFLVDRLKYQARVEKPINEDGFFPSLKNSTIKSRANLAKSNSPHVTFEPSRSNLTLTGQFLDALKYLVKGTRVSIFFDGDHDPYKNKDGQPIGRSVRNEDLAYWLKLKGFKVFDKSINQNATIKNRIKSIVLRYIRRGLNVRSKL